MVRMFIRWPLVTAFAATALLAALSGCGGVGAPIRTPPVTPAAAAIDGRWGVESVTVVPVGTTPTVIGPTLFFSGVLRTSGDVVDGVGQAYFGQFGQIGSNNLMCLQPGAVTVHGTLNSARHLSLASSQVNGTAFTIDVDVPASLDAPINATASAIGTCAVPSGTALANYSRSLTGRYAGMLNGVTQAGLGVAPVPETATPSATMMLSETDPDAGTGQSTITGSATLTFAACSVTLPVSTTRTGALNQGISIYPATPPVVLVSGGRGTQAQLLVVYLDANCKTQPATAPPVFTEWGGLLNQQQ
jgi:hypothetical protein